MIRIYKDREGVTRAETADPSQKVLASYLEEDIQSSVNSVDRVLCMINEIGRGERPSWKATGNAHTIVISKATVKIVNEYTNDSTQVNLDTFTETLSQWRNAIEKRPQ